MCVVRSDATCVASRCFAPTVPGQGIYAGPHNVNQWLNPAAFASPPVATANGQSDYSPLGGAPTQFYGPGFHRLDFSLFKDFRTTEGTHLEFRSEFFNLTNHPNFSPPGFSGNGVVAAPGSLDYTSPTTFGKIASTRDGQNDQREPTQRETSRRLRPGHFLTPIPGLSPKPNNDSCCENRQDVIRLVDQTANQRRIRERLIEVKHRAKILDGAV